jgi:integrase
MDQVDNNKKWPIILMAYTGARNGEIMQLRKEDVLKCPETNIDYINITDAAGSVKTKSSNRRVPIHPRLKELGFLSFVDSVIEETLFTKSSRYLTSQYSDFIKPQLEIPSENLDSHKLNLYSMRHSFITCLRGKGVNSAHTQQIAGHSSSSTITDGYTHYIELKELAKSVNKISYSDRVF